MKKKIVTAALPYANGPIHIGHLAGVYIPADIYTRYLRMKGEEVIFVCGSDEHGVPITISAKKENITPQQVVDKYHQLNKESFQQFGISFDIFSRTSSKLHHKVAADFFLEVYDKGILEIKETKQYFDPKEETFLADRYIKGTCPTCSFQEAYGDQCEKCGKTLSPNELINPKSAISGSTPILKKTKHWYLPLNKYQEKLEKWILHEHQKDWKNNVLGQCKSWLDEGLKPRAVTRDLNWGVQVPLKEAEGKVLYVWFDAPIGYISATKELCEANGKNWKDYWQSSDSELIHFVGKDNIVFHCIIFPVMLMAHGKYIMPQNVPANEFMNLEGKKISTSRNWAVWLPDYLRDFPGKEDILRYVLTANMPENKDSDFTWEDYRTRNNSELVAIVGNFVNRTVVLLNKYFDNTVPERMKLEEIDIRCIEEIQAIPQKYEIAISEFKFRECLSLWLEISRIGNRYLAETEPWNLMKEGNIDRVKTIISICINIVANIHFLSKIMMPFTAEKLKQILDLHSKLDWKVFGQLNIIKENHKINKSDLLFEKME